MKKRNSFESLCFALMIWNGNSSSRFSLSSVVFFASNIYFIFAYIVQCSFEWLRNCLWMMSRSKLRYSINGNLSSEFDSSSKSKERDNRSLHLLRQTKRFLRFFSSSLHFYSLFEVPISYSWIFLPLYMFPKLPPEYNIFSNLSSSFANFLRRSQISLESKLFIASAVTNSTLTFQLGWETLSQFRLALSESIQDLLHCLNFNRVCSERYKKLCGNSVFSFLNSHLISPRHIINQLWCIQSSYPLLSLS